MPPKNTSNERILYMLKKKYPKYQIAKTLGTSLERISYVEKYFEEHHEAPPEKRLGRPKKVSPEVENEIVLQTAEDPFSSSRSISVI